jgi:hypothetical protein
MAKLSITTAWEEAVRFVRRDAGLLFTIALALCVLPGVALQILAPSLMPEDVTGRILFLLVLMGVLVLSIAGTLAITALTVGRENVVGSALRLGFRRCPAMLGAAILIGLMVFLLLIPIVAISGVDPDAIAAQRPEAAAQVGRVILLLFLVFVLIWPRLLLMTPVAALEPVGSLGIIRRSWAMSKGHYWKLLGFAALLFLVILVVMLAVTFVFGSIIALVAGPPNPGTLAASLMLLIGGILNAVIIVFFTTLIARIYVQLSDGVTSGS